MAASECDDCQTFLFIHGMISLKFMAQDDTVQDMRASVSALSGHRNYHSKSIIFILDSSLIITGITLMNPLIRSYNADMSPLSCNS